MTNPSKSAAQVTAHSTALIAQDSVLRGDITIGQGCIIHPRATIDASFGPIVIGADCVIEETAVITNRRESVLRIGDGNYFMVGSQVEAVSIGNHNTFKPKSKVSSLVAVTDHCTFSPGTVTFPSDPASTEVESLPPYTVIYGAMGERRKWDGSTGEIERAVREKEMEYLREILPKYSRMRAV